MNRCLTASALAAAAASLLLATGCEGRNAGLPPTGGHAYVIGDAPASGSAAGGETGAGYAPAPFGDSATSSDPATVSVAGGAPGPGETTVVVTADDGLYEIARAHQVSLAWLIERNDLSAQPAVGSVLVVPNRAGQ